MAEPAPRVVTLYTSTGCGLCDPVREELQALSGPLRLTVEVIDIATDAALERAYRWAVPVVALDGREIARAPIRPGMIGERLREMR